MAKKTPTTEDAAALETTTDSTSSSRGRRLTIVFADRFEPLYDLIVTAARADDRDPDTFILRLLDKAFMAPAAN